MQLYNSTGSIKKCLVYIHGKGGSVDEAEHYRPLFSEEVRSEYENILEDIKAHCCHINYFIHPQANRMAAEIYEKYGDEPIFPWDDFSGGVFKNPTNGKWYAIVIPFYVWKSKKYTHAVWHAFVLHGIIMHFFAILFGSVLTG